MSDTKVDGLYAHVETEFIRGHRFLSLPVGARMLYIGLWCYALSQRHETIERPPNDYLARVTGLQRHPITTYLERLRDSKLLLLDDSTITVIGLRKKHNKITFKDDLKKTPEILRNLENPSSSPILSTPLQNKTPPLPPKGKGEKKIIEPSQFDVFWKAYPRKVNKGGALKKWNATLTTGETDPDQLIAAAKHYADAVKGKEEKYILHAATFLGLDQRWKDHLDVKLPEGAILFNGIVYTKPEGWTDEMFAASMRYGMEDQEGQLVKEMEARELENGNGKRPSGKPEISKVTTPGGTEEGER